VKSLGFMGGMHGEEEEQIHGFGGEV